MSAFGALQAPATNGRDSIVSVLAMKELSSARRRRWREIIIFMRRCSLAQLKGRLNRHAVLLSKFFEAHP